MEDQLARLLDEVLSHADRGEVVSRSWLRRRYPAHADELAESLQLVGLLDSSKAEARRFGPFRALHELGRGNMGVVYLAEAVDSFDGVETGERIALKVMHSHLMDDPSVQQRFLMEGLAGSRVRHPNVVRMISACRIPTNDHVEHCLLMEVVRGPTLLELRRERTLTPEHLCRHVAHEVAGALAAVHGRGIVHRDVKPQNVVFADDGRVCLMDLGIALVSEANERGALAGSPLYAAPEQMDPTTHVDGRADLYALGRTLFEFATGKAPEGAAPLTLPEAYSPSFRTAVATLTQHDPSLRFQSADELIEFLERSGGDVVPATSYLHGRDRFLEQMDAALVDCRKGRGQVLFIEGGAGIGKTRLVQTFAAGLPDPLLLARFEPEAASSKPALFGLVQSIPHDVPAWSAIREDQRTVLRSWQADRSDEQVPPIREALVALIQAIARERPLVLWVEDAHLAEEHEVETLQELAKGVERAGALVLITARPGMDSTFREAMLSCPCVAEMPLRPLDMAATSALIDDAFHPRRLASSLRAWIADQSGGNPLHALTAVRSLDTDETVRLQLRVDGTWGLPHGGSLAGLSMELDDLLVGRLASLDDEERHVLAIAACAGTQIERALLRAAAPPGGEAVAEALAHEGEWIVPDGSDFRFAHHRLQEVVYRAVDDARRRSIHETLTRHLLGRSDSATLCRHALRGGLADVVRQHAEQAVTGLAARNCWRAAVELGREVLEAPGLIQGEQRLHLLLQFVAVAKRVDPADDDIALMRECRDLADALGRPKEGCEARIALAWAAMRYQRFDEAVSYLRSALTHLAEQGPSELEHRVLHEWSKVETFRDNHAEHRRLARLCVEAAERSGNPNALTEASLAQAMDAMMRGYIEDAGRHYAEALRWAALVDNKPQMMIAKGHLGLVAVISGDFVGAKRWFRETDEIVEQIGDKRIRAIIRGKWSYIAAREGRWSDAVDSYEQNISDLLDVADQYEAGSQFAGVGSYLIYLGDFPRARTCLDEAARLAERSENRVMVGDAKCRLALLERWSGADEIASRLFEEGFECFGPGARNYSEHRVNWAEALLVDGDLEAATEHMLAVWDCHLVMEEPNWMTAWIDCWLGWLRSDARGYGARMLSDHPDRIPRDIHAHMHFARWAETDDAQHLERARALLSELRANAPAEYRETMIEHVPIHRLIVSGRKPPR